jgi:hypothetical protein
MSTNTIFEIGSEYERFDSNTNCAHYLGSFNRMLLVSCGSHGATYDFYFNNNGVENKHTIIAHPMNPLFSGIRKRV